MSKEGKGDCPYKYKDHRIKQIRAVHYIVEFGNMTRAGRALGLSQSVISMQMASLERDIGIKVFERNLSVKSCLRLTPEGQEFYDHAVPNLKIMENLYESFAIRLQGNKDKIIRIAAHHVPSCYILPDVIKEFSDDYRFELSPLSRSKALDDLGQNIVDMAIYPLAEIEMQKFPQFEWYKMCQYKPVLIMNKKHPLSKKNDDEITMNDVVNDALYVGREYTTKKATEVALKRTLTTKLIVTELNFELIKTLIAKNLGIIALDRMNLNMINDNSDIRMVDVLHLSPNTHYYIAINKNNITSKLLKIIQQCKTLFQIREEESQLTVV